MDQTGKDDLKTQFVTREGTYRLMTLSEYSRPNRVGYQSNQSNPQVRVSLVTLPASAGPTPNFGGSGGVGGHPQQPAPRSIANSSSNASSTSTFTGPGGGGGGVGGSDAVVMSPTPQHSLANGNEVIMHHHLPSPTTSNTTIGHHHPPGGGPPNGNGGGDRICFNFGKELYVYAYRGCKKLSPDLSKPVDKKLYKGTNPSCHDFNETVATSDGAPLLVGFTTGQIQLVQPGKREPGRLFNEERLIDKTKVTCLKWLPRSPHMFLASHASGHLYVYDEELNCTPSGPSYTTHRTGDGFTVHASKSKQPRNPLFRWTLGPSAGCINELAFSPCGQLLAIVSQDGFLRVFHYERMELMGVARSYFGGFLCVCWSPDGKYIVVGGEDDLVTVWSLHERRVVARGQGHRSWVSVVAFDPYTSYTQWDGPDLSDDEHPANDGDGTFGRCYPPGGGGHDDDDRVHQSSDDCGDRFRQVRRPRSSSSTIPDKMGTSYRLGSVSQDTQLCLWDITEDILRQSHECRHRPSAATHPDPSAPAPAVVRNGGESDTVDPGTNRLSDSCPNSVTGGGNGQTAHHSIGTTTKSASKSAPTNDSSGSVGASTGLTALNTLTQRLTSFSFGGDGKRTTGDSSKKTSSTTFHFPKAHPPPPSTTQLPSAAAAPPPAAAASCSTNVFLPRATTDATASSSSSSSAPVPGSTVPSYDPMRLIGTAVCPRFDECPLLEPLVCKKIAHERLTALVFREDCFLTACQDGFIYTWARPGVPVSSVD